jgi:hypothetical protein
MSGGGDSAKITFVNPQSYPSLRVWGMNTDDSANVLVNGTAYYLDSQSASYDEKVICNVIGSPGSEGIEFISGSVVGVNGGALANYSYQNIIINEENVNTLTITGIAGAGWGFGGVTINNTIASINQLQQENSLIEVYPNPSNDKLYIRIPPLNSIYELEVISQLGITVSYKTNIPKDIVELDISNLSKGSYIILLRSKDNTISKRFVKN